MIMTYDGKPVEFIITPASTADITAFKIMEIDLSLDASIYGDKAYTQYSLEDDLQEFEKIRLIAEGNTLDFGHWLHHLNCLNATWARI